MGLCDLGQGPLATLFLLLKIFWCRLFLKSLFNLLQFHFFFFVLVFWPGGMRDLSSPTRDQTHIGCSGGWGLTHWTTREILSNIVLGVGRNFIWLPPGPGSELRMWFPFHKMKPHVECGFKPSSAPRMEITVSVCYSDLHGSEPWNVLLL